MKLDDYIVNREWMLSPFKKIHPNLITLTGMVCNVFIITLLLKGYVHWANLLLIIKYFCDCLDGGVARKYNKTSKLGGYLDTISDVTLMAPYCGVVTWAITGDLTYSVGACLISLFVFLGYFTYQKALFEHDNIKSGGENVIEKIVEFAVINSIIVYLLVVYFNATHLKELLQ